MYNKKYYDSKIFIIIKTQEYTIMKKILLIATGGTIASKYTKEGLSPQISAEELLEYIPTAKEFCTIGHSAAFFPGQYQCMC